ncbi:MAG TPA: phage holin family protein [Polyangiaceae bacterium]|nr:phage holin family protein [Polyangiaceae bacterium]
MIASILLSWLTASIGLWFAAKILDDVRLTSFVDAIWAGALLGVLQALLGTLIFVLLGIGTLGIGFLLWFVTRWIASAIVILITAALSSRLEVRGFLPALITAFIVAVTGTVVRWLI